MNAGETINLLSHYRHDWVNQLQLLQGYAAMGKLDKVKEIIEECTKSAEQERKLTRLNIPNTALWLLTFNWRYNNFRVNYDVHISNYDLANHDKNLHSQLDDIMGTIHSFSDEMEMYGIQITFGNTADHSNNGVGIQLFVSGYFKWEEELKHRLLEKHYVQKITREREENEKTCCTIWMMCN